MFGKSIPLFKIFGFSVKLDFSWFVIALLITWSLATGVFPSLYGGLAPGTYWWMGFAGAIGLFASIVLHELGHSIVAQRYGLPIRGITLFIFGGVAEMEDEPQSPKIELLVAIAGPIVSVLIALVGWGLATIGQNLVWPTALVGVLVYLAFVNGLLVIFNLIPAFPLDGGRVLRSALWKWRGSLRWATRITSAIGAGFGIVLISLGIVNLLLGNFLNGLWTILIGFFLRNAATISYQQLLLRQALEGEPVRRFMAANPIVVPPMISVQELIDDYIYRYYHKLFPVVEDDQLVGCVTADQVRSVPHTEWAGRTVLSIMDRCSAENTISPDADAMAALARMSRTNRSRLLVVEDDKLCGIITLKDLLRFFSLKMELEDEPPARYTQSATEQRHPNNTYGPTAPKR
jgi:Zn-dependent protease/CBS domain-containing protein